MIRTNSVQLTCLPGAIAYRRKSASGGPAIVVLLPDVEQPGIATISKTSGEAIPAANNPEGTYPAAAFAEAIELTAGMPYHRQGKPAAPQAPEPEPDPEPEELEGEVEVIVDGADYERIVDAYTDKSGRLSYDLMNKEMVQFAHKSDMVSRMIAAGEDEDAIVRYVVATKFQNASGNKDLTDEQVALIAELIDEVSPRGAFKELRSKVRSMLGEAKRG